MPKTKKYIDKKNAVTFNLVHRSQKDPLAADETAPQRVLVPITLKPEKKPVSQVTEQDKEKQREFGIFFDDDYNYLQHLKDVNLTAEWELAEDSKNSRVWKAPIVKGISSDTKLKLPSSVFPSTVEEKIGLLNRAAPHSGPRLDLDPDIVAALDEDFDFENPDNELEDDFIDMANAGVDDEEDIDEETSDDSGDDDYQAEDGDSVGDLRCEGGRLSPTFDMDETKSRFTEYSMTSSVIRRNNQLSLLDDRFEQFMAEYDGDEMGSLDGEEIEGYIDSSDSRLLKLVEDFEEEKTMGSKLSQEIGKKARHEVEDAVEKYLDTYGSNEDSDDQSSEAEDEPQKKWDCESILSTYSNLYNHPKLIAAPLKPKISVCPKTGIPLDILGKPGLTKKYLEQLDQAVGGPGNSKNPIDTDCAETRSIISTLSTISIRPKDETSEQRRERKQLVKEFRRERRAEKKANSTAFKEEKKRQERQNMNNRVNVQGVKLL